MSKTAEQTDCPRQRTIADFGEQWTAYRDNEGFYGSSELFADLFEPLIDVADLKDTRVADIGSGTGRIVNMLLDCEVAHVTAVEPSDAFHVLRENVSERADRVTCVHAGGEDLEPTGNLDYVFSAGVLHHIPDPDPVVISAREALRPGGRLAIWLYGREGNALYLAFALPLRALTTRMPHKMLAAFCWCLYPILAIYIALCRVLPLPMRRYMLQHLGELSASKRVLTIYDQLNPLHAKYYTRAEAIDLLERNGFADVRAHHRHGYSWTVVGIKPPTSPGASTAD